MFKVKGFSPQRTLSIYADYEGILRGPITIVV